MHSVDTTIYVTMVQRLKFMHKKELYEYVCGKCGREWYGEEFTECPDCGEQDDICIIEDSIDEE